jgi:hypothetical protein
MGKPKAKADPPFGFAQGRLFGDDNKKSNSNGNYKRWMCPGCGILSHPYRDTAAA